MKFRDAEIEDLPAIVALLADDHLGAKRELPGDPLSDAYTDAFHAIKKQSGNRVIVVDDSDGRLCGCLQLTITPGLARTGMTRATIEGVRIRKDRRETGLGGKLLEYAICEAKKAKCGMVQLTTDAERSEARRFYEKRRFVASHIGMKLTL